MLKRKSQASFEYLSTYAWAFLVILVIVGAIQYLGFFDFQKYLPQKCSFTSQFPCTDFSVGGGDIRAKVVNNIGAVIVLEGAEISNQESPPLVCSGTSYVSVNELAEVPFTTPVNWEEGVDIGIRFTGCSGGGYLPKERVDAIINLVYYSDDTPGQPRHETKGRVSAAVRE
tara:strand:+ start:144 stop:656 length:513 start_codon:yes stop_codon:yes gene_type:complete